MVLPPRLEPRYRIEPLVSAGSSLDELVATIIGQASVSPVLRTVAASPLMNGLPLSAPQAGVPLDTAIAELQAVVGRHWRRNAHPGFHAYVAAPGLPTDPWGHALAAAWNQNLTGYPSAPGATVVELTVIHWFRDLAGLPAQAGGLMVSGGSMANLTALTVAVHRALGPESRRLGLTGGPRPVLLVPESAHFSIQRAALMLGLGEAGILTVPCDYRYRLRLDALAELLERLAQEPTVRTAGVVASAGSTATGAIDPLPEIAALCRQYGVWLHVDAAYGGGALLADSLRGRLRGLEQADSITIDLHKWCYLALDASVLLYRQPRYAREVFSFHADYAQVPEDDAPESHSFLDLGPEVSRRARALPAYLAFRHYGLDVLGRNIRHNADCASYLAALVKTSEDFELINEPELSICCFRYAPPSFRDQPSRIDQLNTDILAALNRSGNYLLSPTRIGGRPILRVCICSHSTQAAHVAALVAEIHRIGRELTAT